MSLGQFGESDIADSPPAMADAAAKRRLAQDVAGEPDSGGIEAVVQRDPASFSLFPHGLDGEMLAQHFAAAVMHEAGRGAESASYMDAPFCQALSAALVRRLKIAVIYPAYY